MTAPYPDHSQTLNDSEDFQLVERNESRSKDMEIAASEPQAGSGFSPADTVRPGWFLARCLYLVAGLLCLGLATAGAFLPVLPCTPFVLLAVFCFARSSTRLHGWLLRSRLFGGIIRDWQQHRAIRRHVRRSSVVLIVAVLLLSLWMVQPGWLGAVALAGLVGIGLLVIFRLPVCD